MIQSGGPRQLQEGPEITCLVVRFQLPKPPASSREWKGTEIESNQQWTMSQSIIPTDEAPKPHRFGELPG